MTPEVLNAPVGRGRRIVDILPQPDDVTCGPTCLHAVYGYWGDVLPIDTIIREVTPLESRGTLAVLLGVHALRRGYAATLYTYNLAVFDPSWFRDSVDIAERLEAQARAKADPKLRFATDAYLEFLRLGGELRFRELGPALLSEHLDRGRPILCGLSATYLYDCAREIDENGVLRYDDVRGEPTGHFVVLSDYDHETEQVTVADPLHANPRYGTHLYSVGVDRLMGALMLGVITYDANLLVLEPNEPS